MRPTSSDSSATVVAVIVFIGGGSNGTRQEAGPRRAIRRCVQDQDHQSGARPLDEALSSRVLLFGLKMSPSCARVLRRLAVRRTDRARAITGMTPGLPGPLEPGTGPGSHPARVLPHAD